MTTDIFGPSVTHLFTIKQFALEVYHLCLVLLDELVFCDHELFKFGDAFQVMLLFLLQPFHRCPQFHQFFIGRSMLGVQLLQRLHVFTLCITKGRVMLGTQMLQ